MINKNTQDKQTEKERYDLSAEYILKENSFSGETSMGSDNIAPAHRLPYLIYEDSLQKYLTDGTKVLEIGAGTGLFTGTLLESGANVNALDISEQSLDVILKRFSGSENLTTYVADMESLPFEKESFDVVTSAGSLSYGDNTVVMNEIYRVLKPGGVMIVIDSLNNNLIYRFNRYMHYLKGNRSKSTLVRMPTINLIDKYTKKFGYSEVKYFGAVTWIFPLLSKVLTEKVMTEFSNWIDVVFNIKRSAFKFVMMAVKK